MTYLPKPGDLVICKVARINPHSAILRIEDCNREGMVHISEVASGWVKDINKEIKEGETVVAKVLALNENIINLSLKRVDENQKKNRLKEYNRERKAEKMLEIAAKKMKQTQKLPEIKAAIKQKLGTLYSVFEISMKNPSLVSDILSEKWIEAIKEIAEKNIQEKEYEFKAKVRLVTHEPDGVKKIVGFLSEEKKGNLEISYISAPEYMVRFRTSDAKKGGHEFDKRLDEIAEKAKKTGFFREIKILK